MIILATSLTFANFTSSRGCEGAVSHALHVTVHEKTDHSPQIKIFKIRPYEDSLFLAGHADPFSIGLSVAKL